MQHHGLVKPAVAQVHCEATGLKKLKIGLTAHINNMQGSSNNFSKPRLTLSCNKLSMSIAVATAIAGCWPEVFANEDRPALTQLICICSYVHNRIHKATASTLGLLHHTATALSDDS
jgi:hypothetical protein